MPARNTIFLAVALGVAEARDLDAVWIGVNAIDYSGYPDCRPAFIEAFRQVAATGQKRGVEGRPIAIITPLIESTKAGIVRTGLEHRCATSPHLVVLPGGRPSVRHLRRLCPASSRLRRSRRGRPRAVNDAVTPMATVTPLTGPGPDTDDDDRSVYVTEVFSAIQGEGGLVGKRQVFVRLTGCNIRCAYCDQPEALERRAGPCRIERTAGRPDWHTVASPLPVGQVLDLADELGQQLPHHSVSLTGGEPLFQARRAAALATGLSARGWLVMLETNGTQPSALATVVDALAYVSMDVKLPSVDGEHVDPERQRRFLEVALGAGVTTWVKVVVGPDTDVTELDRAVVMVADAVFGVADPTGDLSPARHPVRIRA